MDSKFRSFMPFLLFLIFCMGIVIGMRISQVAGNKPSLFAEYEVGRLEEILNHIDYHYVDTVNTDVMVRDLVDEYLDKEEVIDQIFNKLDPHSNYIPAKSLTAVQEDLEGNFEGIGIEFNIIKDTILVVTPISGGPSEKLGIRSGDKIINIDDSLVAGNGVTNNSVVSLLRGEKGTKVNVSIFRKGEPELLQFGIVRDKIPITSLDVSYMVDEEIGYIKLNRFSATTVDEYRGAMNNLLNHGMNKLILDLRGNPGGYLIAATRIADDFLSGKKMIVYTQNKADRKEEFRAGKIGNFERGQMVVLIDEGSASASEILAGALQDHGRAKVVGRRSFGKGLVQEIFPLRDSSAIRLTIARYYTPSGRTIQRSYDEGVDAYYDDYLSRLKSGGAVPDSVKEKAALSYGVVPDIIVEADTMPVTIAFNRIFNRGLLQRFSYDYYARNIGEFNKFPNLRSFLDTYEISDELYEGFLAFLDAEEYEYEPAELDANAAKVKAAMKAYFGRQGWKNQGFYPTMHLIDDEFQAGLKSLKAE